MKKQTIKSEQQEQDLFEEFEYRPKSGHVKKSKEDDEFEKLCANLTDEETADLFLNMLRYKIYSGLRDKLDKLDK